MKYPLIVGAVGMALTSYAGAYTQPIEPNTIQSTEHRSVESNENQSVLFEVVEYGSHKYKSVDGNKFNSTSVQVMRINGLYI